MIHLVLALLLALVPRDDTVFPPASPQDVGLDPAALELLDAEIERLLEQGAFVGAELHVIQDRRTVLHEAYGFADREDERALEVDGLFCVRSMTKPVGGTAVQMLLDEGTLSLSMRAAELLPAFDREVAPTTPSVRGIINVLGAGGPRRAADITVEHLLTHMAGLPFSTISQPLANYETLADVAVEAAATELLFAPGTDFQYSDAGSDTLGALVAERTGLPVEAFIQARILDPLGMTDTVTLLADDDPALERIPTAYSGGTGNWQPHWRPRIDGPMFPLFLTSQALYSTTTDYARFLALWMDGGRDLLSPDAVERGLTPRNVVPGSCGFDDQRRFYGQQWIVYAPGIGAPRTAFGHDGSDGTFAWAWPERDLMVLFFTQSRGTLVGPELEHVLDRVLLRRDVGGYRAARAARERSGAELAPYEGLYWDEDNIKAYYVVRAREGGLTIERPGAFVNDLVPTETAGHFELAGIFGRTLEFEAPTNGTSPAFLFPFSNRTERQVRHRPDADLPSVASILTGLWEAHGLDAVDDVGTVRLLGSIEMKGRGLEGRVVSLFDRHRVRFKATLGDNTENLWVTADGRAFQQINDGEVTELQGARLEQALLDHPLRRYAGRADENAHLEVLRRIEHGDQSRILVRAVSPLGVGSTMIIDSATGRLVGEDRLLDVPGVGRLGVEIDYGDFQDVGGLTLPMRVRADHSFALIGEIDIRYERADVDIDAEASLVPPGER